MWTAEGYVPGFTFNSFLFTWIFSVLKLSNIFKVGM